MNYGLGEYDNLEVGAGQLFFSFEGIAGLGNLVS